MFDVGWTNVNINEILGRLSVMTDRLKATTEAKMLEGRHFTLDRPYTLC